MHDGEFSSYWSNYNPNMPDNQEDPSVFSEIVLWMMVAIIDLLKRAKGVIRGIKGDLVPSTNL